MKDPILTDCGYVAGAPAADPQNPARIYKGIPYARPPVGESRWKPPEPPIPWTGTRSCTQFSQKTAQVSKAQISGMEDSLYLNILTPAEKCTDRLPVMVWIHGGGYTFGNANSPRGNSPRLPGQGVVVVNVNMRLGVMGLLAHRLLTAESPEGVSGNYMFLDMIAALKWIRNNIAAFGGDPDNVTLFGQSGGGAKIATLMASPLAKGLFHKAILESGTATRDFFPGRTLAASEADGARLFDALKVFSLKDARSLPVQEILKAAVKCGVIDQDASVDGWFLEDLPEKVFLAGKQHPLPFIVMANLGEIIGPGSYFFPQLISGYINMLRGAKLAKVRGYAAIFDQVPENWRAEGVNATHAMELTYVFGDWDDSTGEWDNTWLIASETLDLPALSKPPRLTAADRRVSEAAMRLFARFARTGNPRFPGMIAWPEWTEERDEYLAVQDPLTLKRGFSRIAPAGRN